MILCIEIQQGKERNPREFIHAYIPMCTHTHTPMMRTNKFIQVEGYGIKIQKLIVFLYTSNEQLKRKLRK